MSDESANAEPVWTPLPQSNNVQAARYDADAGELLVQFSGGRTYAYRCGKDQFDLLVNSPSPGSYVHRHLKSYSAREA